MSIYATIGGSDSVSAAVDLFYGKVLHDDVLAPYFSETDMRRQKAHMRAFLAVAMGGPELYAGRDMAAAHRGLNVTDEAFDHVVTHLIDTLDKLGVPADVIAQIGEKVLPLRTTIVTAAAA